MDFDFRLPDDYQNGKRKAYRVTAPGLEAHFKQKSAYYKIKDLSATGMAIVDKELGFKKGQKFAVDLTLNKRRYVSGIKAEVVRCAEDGTVGLMFHELEFNKEVRLDKLVVEIQKRAIEYRKRMRSDQSEDKAESGGT